ncbi:MAG TPA: hypothetical protein ENN40_05125 [Candidatus Aminicenantes bacterium]|nr:hypothetical protein [Candidatus Aminicenantes bacterium]
MDAATPGRFMLKLSLGGGRLNLDDISAVVREGESSAATRVPGGTMVPGSGIPEPGPCYDAGAELLVFLSPRWALGLEVALNGNTKMGQVGWMGSENTAARHASEVRHTVVPIRLSARYFLGRRGFRAYALAGAGLYPGRLNLIQKDQVRSITEESLMLFVAQGRGTAVGLHAGVGAAFPLTRRLRVFVEAVGQSVRIASLNGGGIIQDLKTGLDDWNQGEFWVVTFERGGRVGKKVVVASEQPDDPTILQAKKLEMDLSGWTLRAGIIIGL